MSLTIDEIERYKGQINLKKINIQGQLKLKKRKNLNYRSWWHRFAMCTFLGSIWYYEFWNCRF